MVLERLRRQAAHSGDPVLAALLDELSAWPPLADEAGPAALPTGPLPELGTPLRLRTPLGVIALIGTVTVFGTPNDITLAELAIEALFPADAERAARLAALIRGWEEIARACRTSDSESRSVVLVLIRTSQRRSVPKLTPWRKLMPRIATTLVFALLLPLATGCATITRGTTEAWTVDSRPQGADVRLSTGEECVTPCTLKLKRKTAFSVEVSKPGYRTVTTDIVSQVAGAGAAGMAGNVLVGGIIGVGVDAASGATKELKPNPLMVELEAE